MKRRVTLAPAEQLIAALLALALKDARGRNECRRHEACSFLWQFAPEIASRAGLPALQNGESMVQ